MRHLRPRVRFSKRNRETASSLSSTSSGYENTAMANTFDGSSRIPWYYLKPPMIHDRLETETSKVQQETVNECLPLLGAFADPAQNPLDFNEFGIPTLEKDDHIAFLHENLSEFPAQYVGIDASRPWMVYWALLGLYLLGEDVTQMRSRVYSTFYPLQNPDGGFSGGHGHYSHLAATYAALLSIAIVGGEENYKMVNRKAMWHWLGRLKQADGGFQICEGGEVDTRGAYCALIVLSLLALPVELPRESPARATGMTSFIDGLGGHLSRCQTYEGGISGAAGNEAHGAYAFCAIGCLCLLDVPETAIKDYLDMEALLSWLSARQYAPEGGYAGRTNKLVDGCYSHWIGSCWPLVQAAIIGAVPPGSGVGTLGDQNLYDNEGLARYILCCCQAKYGGLRDKPSKRPDSYHTCYTLLGVSTAEHFHFYRKKYESRAFESAFSWESVEPRTEVGSEVDSLFDDGTDLPALHAVYAIPHRSVSAIRKWFEDKHFKIND